ncbi:MAG TPA: histidine phosphatase family protein [Ktedonobacterales bacterium]|nr:histidine phosphatase family protein [Ktedonobacterales bacterium]
MRRLLLVRHAAPAKNPALSAREWALSPSGRADAERLAEILAPFAPAAIFPDDPAAIVASDELKARQTAQPLADRLGLSVEVVAGLHEHERGAVGYMDDETFQATMARFFAEPDTLVFGEETANQALARFSRAVEETLARYPEGDIAIFTHGTVMSLFVAAHSIIKPMDFWWRLHLPAWVIFAVPDFKLLDAHMQLPKA